MLDARQLQALVAVVEHGGFGPAAQALSLTLAAVSLRIKALEEHLGQRLLVRGKRVRATAAGQALLAHVKQVSLMEADLLSGLQGGAGARTGERWQSLSVALNADSVASWFLPGVAPLLRKHHLLLDMVIDDQDHTHDLLKSGDVMGCVTALAEPMRGCVAEPLGVMRYRCMAAPEVAQSLPHAGRRRVTPQAAGPPGHHLQPQRRLAGHLSEAAIWLAATPLPTPFRPGHRCIRDRDRAGPGLGHGARAAPVRPPRHGRGPARCHGGRGPVLATLGARGALGPAPDPGGESGGGPEPAAAARLTRRCRRSPFPATPSPRPRPLLPPWRNRACRRPSSPRCAWCCRRR